MQQRQPRVSFGLSSGATSGTAIGSLIMWFASSVTDGRITFTSQQWLILAVAAIFAFAAFRSLQACSIARGNNMDKDPLDIFEPGPVLVEDPAEERDAGPPDTSVPPTE